MYAESSNSYGCEPVETLELGKLILFPQVKYHGWLENPRFMHEIRFHGIFPIAILVYRSVGDAQTSWSYELGSLLKATVPRVCCGCCCCCCCCFLVKRCTHTCTNATWGEFRSDEDEERAMRLALLLNAAQAALQCSGLIGGCCYGYEQTWDSLVRRWYGIFMIFDGCLWTNNGYIYIFGCCFIILL